jgi:hypothetical protein
MELYVNLKDHGENASQKQVFARRIDVFKKTFNPPFPLFPGNNVTIHKAPGDVRSPYSIGIETDKDGPYEVVHSELGSFIEAHVFLKSIITASGLKQEGWDSFSLLLQPQKSPSD